MKYIRSLFVYLLCFCLSIPASHAASVAGVFEFGGGRIDFSTDRHVRPYLSVGTQLRSDSEVNSLSLFVGMLPSIPISYNLNPTITTAENFLGVRWSLAPFDFLKIGFLGGKVNRSANNTVLLKNKMETDDISGDANFLGADITLFSKKKEMEFFIQYMHLNSVENRKVIQGENVHFNVPESDVAMVGLRIIPKKFGEGNSTKNEKDAEAAADAFRALRSPEAMLVLIAMLTIATAVTAVYYAGKGAFVVLTAGGKKPWGRLSYNETMIFNASESKEIVGQKSIQKGLLQGGRMSFGSEENLLGVGLEGGMFQYSLYNTLNGEIQEEDKMDFKATYFMLGPRLQSAKGRFYFEILAGGTNDPVIKALSAARFGVSIPILKFIEMGLDLGGFYVDYTQDSLLEINKINKFAPAASAQFSILF